jgi:phosphatidylglycerophosphate synthase
LCNLFDGMVAIEGGKSTASGELFNDIPDRIADPIILIAAGYSITLLSWGSTLGWSAALLAVLTAYVRTLSLSIGAPADFSGPMAKQHRMAIMTIACIIAAIEPFMWPESYSLLLALIVINIGCIATLINRTHNAYCALEKK